MIKEEESEYLKGIGINCSKMKEVSEFGHVMGKELPHLTLLTYPNSGEEWVNGKC